MAGEFCHRIACVLAEGHLGPCRFCRCGPNEACSRCSTPRPVGVFFGKQYAEEGPGGPYATTAEDAMKAAARRAVERQTYDERRPRGPQPMVGLDAPLPQSSCAHQWLPHGVGAWCPNCDAVKSPPR